MKTEVWRKVLHMGIIITLPIAALSKGILVLFILCLCVLYLSYESYIHTGGSLPIVTRLVDRAKRLREKKIARAPFMMMAGVGITVLIFSIKPAAAGIFQLAFCDMAASLVGKMWGSHKISYSPSKSWEGTAAFFVMSAILMSFLYPWYVGLLLAFVGALIESLPWKDWDNLLIPVGVAAIASFF